MSKSPSCFIIMPITMPEEYRAKYADYQDHFEHVLDHLFIPAIQKAGLTPVKPIVEGSDIIQAEIIKHIEKAELVLCDMSTLNPNVFFEFGIRTALDKPVCLVIDDIGVTVPLDTSIIHYHIYDNSLKPWTLEEEQEKLANHIKTSFSKDNDNALWRHFGIKKLASLPSGTPTEEQKFEYLSTQLGTIGKTLSTIMKMVSRGEIQKPIPDDFRDFHEEIQKLDEKLIVNKRSIERQNVGDFYKGMGDYEKAIEYYEEAFEIDSNNVGALIEKAYCLKRTNREQKDYQALELIEKALMIDPRNPRALYNRACYKCLLGKPLSEILADLREAISLRVFYRDAAKDDRDFTRVADEPEFKKLLATDG